MKTKITARIARREGVNLDGREKIARILAKRSYPPGAHGPTSRGHLTDYGKQLREKQKAKRMYGMTEKQFYNWFSNVANKRGNTSELFIKRLESRFDNAVYRAGFAKTRAEARQRVGHAHFDVNGKKVNIPSYLLKEGDVVSVRMNKHDKGPWKGLAEIMKNQQPPSWISADPASFSFKVTGAPSEEEMKSVPFDSKLIVEFYSR